MKIIFLDIDGVLNTAKTFEKIYFEYKETGIRRIEIDVYRLEYLKKIIDETGALIVLSSSWRNFFEKDNNGVIPTNEKGLQLVNLFEQYDLSIYDITPYDNQGIRQKEIISWMNGKDISNFTVIDDDSQDLSIFVNNGLIKTNFNLKDKTLKNTDDCCGLCEKHMEQAINILNSRDNKRKIQKYDTIER